MKYMYDQWPRNPDVKETLYHIPYNCIDPIFLCPRLKEMNHLNMIFSTHIIRIVLSSAGRNLTVSGFGITHINFQDLTSLRLSSLEISSAYPIGLCVEHWLPWVNDVIPCTIGPKIGVWMDTLPFFILGHCELIYIFSAPEIIKLVSNLE